MTVETLQIFQLDRDQVWTGARAEVLATDGAPAGWAIAPEPPELAGGQRLRWDGAWAVLTVAQSAAILDRTKAAAIAELGAQRWAATQTFTYDDVEGVPADSALSAVVGFIVGAMVSPPSGATTWQLAPGVFRSWTFDQVKDYGIAIRTHIQMCFDVVAELVAEVNAATTPEAVADVLATAPTSWPT